MPSCNLYENLVLHQFTDDMLRPGGWQITQRMLALAPFSPGATLLDLGCGAGKTVAFLRQAGYNAAGLDLSASLVAKGLAEDATLPLCQGDAAQLPFAEGTFQGVLCECAFSLFQHKPTVLQEIRRVLKPSGYFLLSDFYRRGPITENLPCHTCLNDTASQTDWQQLFQQNGFTQVAWVDQTDLLRSFTAQIIFAYGSLAAFWQAMLGAEAGSLVSGHSLKHTGYFTACWRPLL